MRAILGAFVLCVGLFGCANGEGVASSVGEVRVDCSAVRCALPICAEGQHLATSGNECCPHCAGPTSRCAGIACPMYLCAQGYHLETRGNECCGSCVADHNTAECAVDSDCPQIYCFACPCPVSTCQGHQCRTSTPDASSCGI